MAKLALLLSILASAAAGFLVYERYGGCASCRGKAEPESTPPAAVEERLAALEARFAALEKRPELASAPGPGLASGSAPAGSGAARPATPAELEKRLADLEKKERESAEVVSRWRATGGDTAGAGQTAEPATAVNGPAVWNTVEEAEKGLALTPHQKAEFERAAEDAKRERDELKKTPDDEGKTWEQVEKDVFKMDGNSFSFDMTKMQAFREKLIPGRNESFGTADRRITDAAKRRMRDVLAPDQQAKFDKAAMPGLTGGGGGGFGDFMISTIGPVDTVTVEPGMDGK